MRSLLVQAWLNESTGMHMPNPSSSTCFPNSSKLYTYPVPSHTPMCVRSSSSKPSANDPYDFLTTIAIDSICRQCYYVIQSAGKQKKFVDKTQQTRWASIQGSCCTWTTGDGTKHKGQACGTFITSASHVTEPGQQEWETSDMKRDRKKEMFEIFRPVVWFIDFTAWQGTGSEILSRIPTKRLQSMSISYTYHTRSDNVQAVWMSIAWQRACSHRIRIQRFHWAPSPAWSH